MIWNIWDNKKLRDYESRKYTLTFGLHISICKEIHSPSLQNISHTLWYMSGQSLCFEVYVSSKTVTVALHLQWKTLTANSTATRIHRTTCRRFVHKLIFDYKHHSDERTVFCFITSAGPVIISIMKTVWGYVIIVLPVLDWLPEEAQTSSVRSKADTNTLCNKWWLLTLKILTACTVTPKHSSHT